MIPALRVIATIGNAAVIAFGVWSTGIMLFHELARHRDQTMFYWAILLEVVVFIIFPALNITLIWCGRSRPKG